MKWPFNPKYTYIIAACGILLTCLSVWSLSTAAGKFYNEIDYVSTTCKLVEYNSTSIQAIWQVLIPFTQMECLNMTTPIDIEIHNISPTITPNHSVDCWLRKCNVNLIVFESPDHNALSWIWLIISMLCLMFFAICGCIVPLLQILTIISDKLSGSEVRPIESIELKTVEVKSP